MRRLAVALLAIVLAACARKRLRRRLFGVRAGAPRTAFIDEITLLKIPARKSARTGEIDLTRANRCK